MKLIKTLDDLKALASEGPAECCIMLNGGMRSSKDIWYWPEGYDLDHGDADNIDPSGLRAQWSVFNYIDDSEVAFATDEEMLEETMIGEAINKGALYLFTRVPA